MVVIKVMQEYAHEEYDSRNSALVFTNSSVSSFPLIAREYDS